MPLPSMPGQQSAASGDYRSPFGSGHGSSSSSTSGGARQSSGYSLNAQRETSPRPTYHGSNNRFHPEPIRPPNYSTPYASVRNETGSNGTSYQPGATGHPVQASSSQPRSNPAPRLILSPSPEPDLRRSDNKSTTLPSQSQNALYKSISGPRKLPQPQTSRFGYREKPSYSSPRTQGGSSSDSHGHAKSVLPPPAKAPFRASENIAHPSHYQQSTLQFSKTPKASAPPRASFQIVVPTSPAKFYGTDTRTCLTDAPSSSPRRGRPPGGTISKPTDGLPKKRGRPFTNKPRVEPTPKKRGRPFKTIESELKAKARASSSGTSTPTYKKQGRPFKVRHQPFIPQPEPIFNPFLCEWRGCQAELQNLQTLRLHLHIVHKKQEDGGVPCLWAKCGAKKVVEGEDGEKKVLDDHPVFASKQQWMDHLEAKHLVPFSWHMGDGPKATDLSGKPKGMIDPLWLNDSNGNQVTPSIKGQPLEDGRASILNKKRFRKMKGMNIFKEKQVVGGQDLKGAGGMAPPAISSDDEDENTGMDGAEPGPETEGQIDEDDEVGEVAGFEGEILIETRLRGTRVMRLFGANDDDDELMGSTGEDRDEDGDLPMI